MSNSYFAIEERIQAALASRDPSKKINYRKLARIFDVPYQRLLARSKGRLSRSQRSSATFKLDKNQHKALRDWITVLDTLGAHARLETIVSSANAIIAVSYGSSAQTPPRVDRRWATAWVSRQKDLFKVREQRLDVQRSLSHNPDVIIEWFRGLQSLIMEFGIDPADQWNFDETGFRIGVGKDQWIITFHPNVRYLAAPDDRESVTLVEAVNGAGDVIPPLIIMAGKV